MESTFIYSIRQVITSITNLLFFTNNRHPVNNETYGECDNETSQASVSLLLW